MKRFLLLAALAGGLTLGAFSSTASAQGWGRGGYGHCHYGYGGWGGGYGGYGGYRGFVGMRGFGYNPYLYQPYYRPGIVIGGPALGINTGYGYGTGIGYSYPYGIGYPYGYGW